MACGLTDLRDGFDSLAARAQMLRGRGFVLWITALPRRPRTGLDDGRDWQCLLHFDLYRLGPLDLRLRDVHGQDSIPALGANATRIGIVRQR